VLGQSAAEHLHELAHGRDSRPVQPDQPEKSIGAEMTFDRDVTDPAMIRRSLLALAGKAAARVRQGRLTARTISIKVRYADFRTISRSRTLPSGTDVTREVFATAWALFESLGRTPPVRLIGVRLTGLAAGASAGHQPMLGEREHGWREAETAVDRVVARFGPAALRPATLLTGADLDYSENLPESGPVPLSERANPS
jgi:DNA polymerase-4